LLPGQCNRTPGCGWDQGKKGYNDYALGGSQGGYCGRTSC
jgi:hypothetical protein